MISKDLINLTEMHKKKCILYKNYLESIFGNKKITSMESIPYLPVRAFKEFDLLSIDEEAIFKIMTSSGTTGKPSKIFLDKETARAQQMKLIEIIKNTFSGSRFPMIVIDSEATVKNRMNFSARTAAINGFSMFARERFFALDSNNNLLVDELLQFTKKHQNQKIFIFGFTFMIWKYFVQVLSKLNKRLCLDNCFILHGGGWKKLEHEKVTDADFKLLINHIVGTSTVRNYYGMIEQTGTIFMECSEGNLHAPSGGDILIRDFDNLNPCKFGEEGVIQVFSNIQKSYPGHSILTEDIGFSLSGSSCGCGNKSNIVKILGRLENAEVRGCSDTLS